MNAAQQPDLTMVSVIIAKKELSTWPSGEPYLYTIRAKVGEEANKQLEVVEFYRKDGGDWYHMGPMDYLGVDLGNQSHHWYEGYDWSPPSAGEEYKVVAWYITWDPAERVAT